MTRSQANSRTQTTWQGRVFALQTPRLQGNRFKISNQDANNGEKVCRHAVCYFYSTTDCADTEVEFVVFVRF
jgi:hypothetical protein